MEGNLDVPNSNKRIIWTSIFEYHVVRCGSNNGHQMNMSNRNWGNCSKCAHYSWLNSHHDYGDLVDHSMITGILA